MEDFRQKIKELVTYILNPKDRDEDVIENYTDSVMLACEDYHKEKLKEYFVKEKPINDQSYIKDLEGLVCFLSRTYEKLKNTYWLDHLKTCAIDNPERRDLTECEKNELNRFSLIQGSRLQKIVQQFAETNKPTPQAIDDTLKRYQHSG